MGVESDAVLIVQKLEVVGADSVSGMGRDEQKGEKEVEEHTKMIVERGKCVINA